VFVPNTADDPARRKPDITKAKTILGWEPKVPLREGLSYMVDDFKRRLHLEEQAGGKSTAEDGAAA
jgi:UDP-glucuronate decarboxylase